MVGPTELLGFCFVFGMIVIVFAAIARGMDAGGAQHGTRRSGAPGTHYTDHGGTHVGHAGHDPTGHVHHAGHVDTHAPGGHHAGHSHASGFDGSTSFDVGFGAGGDGGFSGGGFDSGGCGGCDSGGGGGGCGD